MANKATKVYSMTFTLRKFVVSKLRPYGGIEMNVLVLLLLLLLRGNFVVNRS